MPARKIQTIRKVYQSFLLTDPRGRADDMRTGQQRQRHFSAASTEEEKNQEALRGQGARTKGQAQSVAIERRRAYSPFRRTGLDSGEDNQELAGSTMDGM
jgi:hypothetical protein